MTFMIVLQGVVDGVSGVIMKPISGAREEGVEGFFKGVGKGMMGLCHSAHCRCHRLRKWLPGCCQEDEKDYSHRKCTSICVEGEGKQFGGSGLSTPNRDLNLDLPIYC
ncbi:unnamed protein product [Timema podura]|uniref:Uncharacterized protein n=1 Tax=Timema podura TaxID=61482 RepID=A0ABN7PJW0_TIMPD|nr:unnamed protein product [Timema podura]